MSVCLYRTADLFEERHRVDDSKFRGLMPKALAIGGGSIGKVENVVVTTHQVAHSSGDRQVDVRFILGIPFE